MYKNVDANLSLIMDKRYDSNYNNYALSSSNLKIMMAIYADNYFNRRALYPKFVFDKKRQ